MSQSLNLELVTRLSKDLKQSSSELGIFEVRYLVDLYYQIQDFRIQTAGQVRNILKDDKDEPHATIGFFADNFRKIEDDIKKILDVYTNNHPVGIWAKSIMGVGPVIAAGLIANLDVKGKPTAGHFWSYCGLASGIIEYLGKAKATKAVEKVIGSATKLDYEQLCEICVNLNRKPKNILTRIENLYMCKKQIDPGNVSKADLVKILSMPPYNTKLKNLCWKIGQSFVKVSNNPNDFYGKIYQEFKAYQNKLNEEGKLADQAKAKLENYNIGKGTEAYKYYSQGMLPPAHIQARAEKHAVKIFISHLHKVMYMVEYGVEPPKPFAISHLNHAHEIQCPNIELVQEFLR